MKKMCRVTAFVLLASLLLVSLLSCTNLDSIEKKLKDADYLVRRYDDGTAAEGLLNEDLHARLVATGPKGEYLTVLHFKERKKAEEYYEVFKDEYTLMQTIILDGNYVMYGTRTTCEMVR